MTNQEKAELALKAKEEMAKVAALDEAVKALIQASTDHMANVSKILHQITKASK